ncbi:hypothetical protein GOBAR_DD28980 [Gossypium barbadense]|nr:hypothetical protein GOBAR_DD28980 [Gossypium barbadense]
MEDRYSFPSLRDGDFEEGDVWAVLKESKDSTYKVGHSSESSIPDRGHVPSAARMIPRTLSAINTSSNIGSCCSSYSHEANDVKQQSAPENIPDLRLARNQISSFSVFEGVGRKLKGRDLKKVRNAVLTKTASRDRIPSSVTFKGKSYKMFVSAEKADPEMEWVDGESIGSQRSDVDHQNTNRLDEISSDACSGNGFADSRINEQHFDVEANLSVLESKVDEAGGLPLDPTAEYPLAGGLNNTGLANGFSHEVRLEQTVAQGQEQTQFKMARKHASGRKPLDRNQLEVVKDVIVKRVWGVEGGRWVFSASIGFASGLLSIWNEEFFSLEDKLIAPRFILLVGHINGLKFRCSFANVYAPNDDEERAQFFSELEAKLKELCWKTSVTVIGQWYAGDNRKETEQSNSIDS